MLLKNLYKLLMIVLLISVWGCEKNEHHKTYTMPLYKECTSVLNNYISKNKDRYEGTNIKLNINLRYFDAKSPVHNRIIGWIEISGENLQQDISIYEKSIMKLCYPETSGVYDATENGLSMLKRQIDLNVKQGINGNYINLKNGGLYLNYNDHKYARYYLGSE